MNLVESGVKDRKDMVFFDRNVEHVLTKMVEHDSMHNVNVSMCCIYSFLLFIFGVSSSLPFFLSNM